MSLASTSLTWSDQTAPWLHPLQLLALIYKYTTDFTTMHAATYYFGLLGGCTSSNKWPFAITFRENGGWVYFWEATGVFLRGYGCDSSDHCDWPTVATVTGVTVVTTVTGVTAVTTVTGVTAVTVITVTGYYWCLPHRVTTTGTTPQWSTSSTLWTLLQTSSLTCVRLKKLMWTLRSVHWMPVSTVVDTAW